MNEMYSFIESSLDYSLYLAENDFARTLAVIDNRAKYITEGNYLVLNESVLGAIRQYLTRVVNSISAAFEKFQKTMAADKAMTDALNLINANQNLLTTGFRMRLPDNFNIPNIAKWNELFTRISGEFKPFTVNDYNSWKEAKALDSKGAFIQHNFKSISDLMGDNDSLDLGKYVYGDSKQNKGVIVTSNEITKFSEYLTDYKTQVDEITKQIEQLNTSTKNVEQYLSSITAAKESYLGLSGVLSILNEEGETTSATTPAKTSSATSPAPMVDTSSPNNKFVDADNPDGDKPEDMNADRKFIVNFYSANSNILSAEMKVCNRIRISCIEIVGNFINIQRKKNGETKKEEQAPEQQQQNAESKGETPQVDTGKK